MEGVGERQHTVPFQLQAHRLAIGRKRYDDLNGSRAPEGALFNGRPK